MSELEPDRFSPRRRGGLGDPYLYVTETTSTQDVLRGSAYAHGTVAVAEHQTAGRGRSGRSWDDVQSKALLFSLLLRPPTGAPLPQLSLVAALAVAAVIEREVGTSVVKWPNDVLVGETKVAGILLEASEGAVVCGVGLNVNQEAHELPTATRTKAASLRLVAGRAFDRGALLAELLVELEAHYEQWLRSGLGSMSVELERRNGLRGERVRIGAQSGTAAEIVSDGRLTVILDHGDTVLVESGEVELFGREGTQVPD